jgi:4-amino-4-deoxy-L-arabinose transferase-like glycosyltransferase
MKNFVLRHNCFFSLCAIVLLAIFLRFFLLDKIPGTLNPDETALGYTSFSLFKAGIDEHGKFLPLALQSFGDWKLPGYSYFSVLPVIFFGLNVFSVRFISALSGVLGVVLVYLIVKALFKKEGLSLISACFYAISPWNIFFSRTGYEVNLAITVFLLGLVFFLKFIENHKSKWLMFSSIVFAGTAFIQHNFIIFTPLFALGLIFIYRKKFNWNRKFLLAVVIFMFLSFISIFNAFFLSANKTGNLLVFNNKSVIYNRSDKLKGDKAPKNYFVEKILYNKFNAEIYQFGENYLNVFTPSFYFDKGGQKLVDSLGYFGNFYLFDAVFIIVGFLSILLKKEKETKLILLWLLLAPIPAALTKDPLTATRLYTLLPLLIILSAYGFYTVINILNAKSLRNYLIKSLLLIFLVYNVVLFMDGYFVHFNYQSIRFWKYGFEQAVRLTQKYPDYKVVMKGPDNFPYIYFLFFNQYDPQKFISSVKYYSTTNEGFTFVKSFDRYSFPYEIDYLKLNHKTIYIDLYQPEILAQGSMEKIYLPSGEPILVYNINN